VKANSRPSQRTKLATLVGDVLGKDQVLDPVKIDDQSLDKFINPIGNIVDQRIDQAGRIIEPATIADRLAEPADRLQRVSTAGDNQAIGQGKVQEPCTVEVPLQTTREIGDDAEDTAGSLSC